MYIHYNIIYRRGTNHVTEKEIIDELRCNDRCDYRLSDFFYMANVENEYEL